MAFLACVLLLGAQLEASAADCSSLPGGILDGSTGAGAPSQIKIDQHCTIRNFPASNPLPTNFSFSTKPGQTGQRWLVVFDNVVHTGQMACNSVAGHMIWFTNGSSTSIQAGCQNLLIPVEKIDKQNPVGTTTAAVGVPFTYTLTMPVLYDPGTGAVINSSGSVNDLHTVVLQDDLNASGADLSYVSHVAYWQSSGAPVPHTFSDVGGQLTFDGFPIVPAGEQIVIELTVVLDATPANAPGTQFINTGTWTFGRLIDGTFFQPLPGENGITPPLTIAAPDLTVTKTGPPTLNLGQAGDFTLDVQNDGLSDAWNVTLLDQLPDGPTGGMCDATPTVLSVEVFAADGVTPVPGKGPLAPGEYGLSYSAAPTCELTLTIRDPKGVIAPTERLVVTYRSQLDSNTQNGVTLTNVAGATEWFNHASANPSRQTFARTLTNGTVGVLDHEDAHSLTTSLAGFFFEKSVSNLTSGLSPATTAQPGDTLRYSLRLQSTTAALNNLTFADDLGALNASAVFVPGSLSIVAATLPPGADATNTNPSGGTNSAGLLDIRNLNVAAGSQFQIDFDITLAMGLANGLVITNQASLDGLGPTVPSDDPNINGQADPFIPGDEDPTRIVIAPVPPSPMLKENTQATAAIGESFVYRVTVPSTPHPVDLYDVQILDDLTSAATGADLRLLSVAKTAGSQTWVPVNTGSATNAVIEDASQGIDIPAGEQIEVELTVVLEDTPGNASGVTFTNTASYLYNAVDNDIVSQLAGLASTTPPMTIVGPDVLTVTKTGPVGMALGTPGPYRLDAQNVGTGPAWNVSLLDELPSGATGGTCNVSPAITAARVYQSNGTTPVSAPLVQGADYSVTFRPASVCEFEFTITSSAGTVGPNERLIVDYDVSLDANTQNNASLTNVAGAIQWFSADATNPGGAFRRTYTELLTNGTIATLDHEDAHSVNTALPLLRFDKTVENLTTGQNPASSAVPGDTLRYTLTVTNQGGTAFPSFTLRDELDALNATAVFEPGTLGIFSSPVGSVTTATDPFGGANGTGLVEVSSLTLTNPGDTQVVVFDVTLASFLPGGLSATNQSQMLVGGSFVIQSDDPVLNGVADPLIAGDEDPTVVPIVSAPQFLVQKTSADLTGDPAVLVAGDTLRYTITVENIGTTDAVDAMLRDAVPVNTTYVPASTTLNGAAVADAAGGVSPLVAGTLIHAPSDPTPGSMLADAVLGNDVATLTFDVVVDVGVIDGTIISNQAFVSAVAGGVVGQPSDDPATPTPDDPTLDIVGSLPLLFAPKSVVIGNDLGSPGVVDPLDTLHYTITVFNNGAVPATAASLIDAVPANTTWVADSLLLNGIPIGVPDGGSSPLALGIDIASSDLTPPLPAPGAGVLNPGQSAVIEFDLLVNGGTPAGTLISNQASVSTAETGVVLTDGDGNASTGPEPTVVVVGAGQQLSISKQVIVVGGGPALAGGQLEYELRITNISTVDALDVLITDDLDVPVAAQLTYAAGTATLDGLATGVNVVGSLLTADYFATYGALAPGATTVVRFRADIAAGLAIGTTITNTGVVSWNAALQSANASVSVDVGGMPGVGVLSGTVWHDEDFDNVLGASELVLAGWTVELLRDLVPIQSTLTDAAGAWTLAGLAPNDVTGVAYALRFRGPGATPSSASLGLADSVFTNGQQEIGAILVSGGSNLIDLNLPIDPNGVVYDSLGRTPVGGATLNLIDTGSGTAVALSCFEDAAQQGQVTRADGYYKFELKINDPSCPSLPSYEIQATFPATSSYQSGLSAIIPPQSIASGPAFNVPACPGGVNDAIPATAAYCEAQTSALAPPLSIPAGAAGTDYHAHLILGTTTTPGAAALFNNHLPVDPQIFGNISINKRTPKREAVRGDLVPYEIDLTNSLATPVADLTVIDTFPAGFKYVEGSARVDGTPLEPTHDANARTLTWTDLGIAGDGTRNVALLLAVGAGVGDGKLTNRAQAVSSLTGNAYSGEATATVRIVPDPDFACTDVIGKVFDDRNRDGSQDSGERGLPGVRLVTARGLIASTDAHGRFHITCAVVPNEERGSNFILKLDERSLPTGYRMSTPTAQVKRATQGKALRFRYGASVHRVVGLDLADGVFEQDSTTMRPEWRPRLRLVLEELREEPATLRVSYLGDTEGASLVERRIGAIKDEIGELWSASSESELSIETEVYWRRGEPARGSAIAGFAAATFESVAASFRNDETVDVETSDALETHLPPDGFTKWSQEPEAFAGNKGDRVEERQVAIQEMETVKLKGVVPAVRFESGAARIPSKTVEELRSVLDDMSGLPNVRLHLMGHADNQPLSASLAAVYGDNEGLSRERAGEVAEYLQRALALPPSAVSFAFAGDREPVASNATAAGRAQNRRVEIEVWYDEPRDALALEDVVVTDTLKRIKVCRTETVCKLRYKQGHERRARVRNLIAPLHIAEDTAQVPDDFVRQVEMALENLRDKQNVVVKFIGYTDDVALKGRAERLYGNHLALSKARAHRVARAVQDRLKLAGTRVRSTGRGTEFPVASNESARGRALNRRIETEFWYDDPLQELPDEPQACPDPGDSDFETRVYDPPWGRIEAVAFNDGEPQIPSALAASLQRALDDVARDVPDALRIRLRFRGYTRNERLDRRTAAVYGDDVGLSAARARRTMERVREAMGLGEEQAEHEGRGFVHSDDVVNSGFFQGDSDHVEVQVVYDEPTLLDDRDGVESTPITRELEPEHPLALNLMHITVDGEPLDDLRRSSSDTQRCTDVAFDAADMRFEFNDLEARPRLSVTSHAGSATLPAEQTDALVASTTAGASQAAMSTDGTDSTDGEPNSTPPGAGARFRMYTNYGAFIERSEVRVFELGASSQDEPIAIVPIDAHGEAQWNPDPSLAATPMREVRFVLRAYDSEGRFDETAPQSLWLVPASSANDGQTTGSAIPDTAADGTRNAPDPLLAGYGETGALKRSIPLAGTGTVRVHGSGVPASQSVWLAGTPIPVDADGNFVAETILPAGMHTVEVAMLDDEGNGELFLRDLEIEHNDWFYTGIADLTVSHDETGGSGNTLQGQDSTFDRSSRADGRLAFFVNGRFEGLGRDWGLTAHADTREGPVKDLFKDFVDKSPEARFRRLDTDYHYPTFGDDGTVTETAPTSGKFYVKLDQGDNHAMWGNFKVGYFGNELAHVDRGLYGANGHYQSLDTTAFGEQRVELDVFGAQPGTLSSREQFRGTGGSLYYLQTQDLLEGSERLRIEVRDKDSGLVSAVVHLRPGTDYDIDYLQGRVLLSEPLSATASDNSLVRTQGLDGDEVWLLVQYEYTPGFSELDALSAGGQGHYWLNDFLRIGATANHNDDNASDSSLYGADLTARKSATSWMKLQYGRSDGLVSTTLRSDDGGFNFLSTPSAALVSAKANAYRADASIGFAEILPAGWGRGELSAYAQQLDAGYSAPGLTALRDTTQYGGILSVPLSKRLDVYAKADRLNETRGLETTAVELDVSFELDRYWKLSAGTRHDRRADGAPVAALTQEVGTRTDALAQIGYDSQGRWRAYVFGQATVQKTGNRDENERYGAGGSYRVNSRWVVDGEASHGESGPALKLGSTFQQSEDTRRYMNYALENERGTDGLHERRGNWISGARTRLSDSGSVFVEDRYLHSSRENGLSRAMGLTMALSENWSLGASWELGTLIDRRTSAETDRNAGGATIGFRSEKVQASGGIEYRNDDAEQPDLTRTERTTWLFRSNVKVQLSPDWRVLAKMNHSMSDSSQGEFFDGGYTEAVFGFGFRPVKNDRLNILAKYTWFSNMPTTDQVGSTGASSQFIQRSHVASVDVSYDITRRWEIGGKFAYRRGEVSLDRADPTFFDNNAYLAILRTNYEFLKNWEILGEGRMLELPDLDERRIGGLLTLYRQLGGHLKVGVGYNFTDFSDDLTDLDYDNHGVFFNVVGSF